MEGFNNLQLLQAGQVDTVETIWEVKQVALVFSMPTREASSLSVQCSHFGVKQALPDSSFTPICGMSSL